MDNSVKQKHTPPAASTQRFLPLGEVRDNILVLKNGGMRAILQTSSVNFNLKSEDEKNALIASYQSFLNTLEFPVQILIRSKKLDVDKYINHVKEISKKQSNPLLQKQTSSYAEYIEKLVEYADIMEKKFYVIVPVDPIRNNQGGFLGGIFKDIFTMLNHIRPQDNYAKIRARRNEFESLKKTLTQRVNTVKDALNDCNIRAEQLNTEEIIEILYQSYNPILSREQKVEDVKKTNLEG